MNSSIFDNLPAGSFLDVMVSLNGKTKTRNLKVCRIKPRSVLFIHVDKPNRVNTFFKIKYSDIEEYFNAIGLLVLKDGKIPDKWESAWDSIGQPSQMSLNNRIQPHYSNHSKGWAPKLPSTTNSVAGFQMV
jgi:hypothetical protein